MVGPGWRRGDDEDDMPVTSGLLPVGAQTVGGAVAAGADQVGKLLLPRK